MPVIREVVSQKDHPRTSGKHWHSSLDFLFQRLKHFQLPKEFSLYHLSNDGHVYFGTMPVTVKRNAYGRQLGSFHTIREMKGIGQVPMTFIRAPYIEKCGEGAEVLAEVDGNIVAVKYKEQYGLAFHPELDEDDRIHEAFLNSVKKYAKKNSPNTWL